MKSSKRNKLEAAGWRVGSASEFLELSDAEAMLVSMKLALARKVKELRQRKGMTQNDLAKLIGSSQSRVAKLESADRSVSMELLVRSLVTRADRKNRRYQNHHSKESHCTQKTTGESVARPYAG